MFGKKRGFTLIELLVVIAIIAVLAAVLFPVFAAAKEQGKKTRCLNNLKQLSAGLMMYAQDSHGYFPHVSSTGFQYSYPTATWTWAGNTDYNATGFYPKYVSNKQVFHCPSDNWTPGYELDGLLYCSYFYYPGTVRGKALNAVIAPTNQDSPSTYQKTGKVAEKRPIILCDKFYVSYYLNDNKTYRTVGENHHLEGGNFLYTDGHITWILRSKLTQYDPGGGYVYLTYVP